MNLKHRRYFTETEDLKIKDSDDFDNGNKETASNKLKQDKKPSKLKGDKQQNNSIDVKLSGQRQKIDGLVSNFQEKKHFKRRIRHDFVASHSKRASILLTEGSGLIEPDSGESTCVLTQKDIVNNVDIASASKHFSLELVKFGPYKFDYTKSGRFLLLGGKMGHLAAFDWLTKDLLCEVNVMESIRDVKWLHNELMFAVAQKRYTYLYDSQGVELHCLKMLHNVLRLDFLPYHFLLAASCSSSFLHWVDVSLGKLVASFPTKAGPLSVMCQNPANAILHCGQSSGVVSLWSPNVKEPLLKLQCHRGPVKSLCVEHSGNYMATSADDRMLKIWDLRALKPLYEYRLMKGADNLAFSQNRFLACSVNTDIQVFDDICTKAISAPYLMHKLGNLSTDVQFCPFDDVLGVGHRSGFTSLLVPGAGEPNFDVYEANPFQSKNQRREAEVRSLLDKIQPEMISLDSGDSLSRIDRQSTDELLREKLSFLTKKSVSNADILLKRKAKGKSASSSVQKRKQLVRTAQQKDILIEQKKIRKELAAEGILQDNSSEKIGTTQRHVLDRFRRKAC